MFYHSPRPTQLNPWKEHGGKANLILTCQGDKETVTLSNYTELLKEPE